MVLKQLKKANASLTQELKECKTNLDESSRALGEATSSRDSSLIALQTKQTELEKYTALNDLTSDYKILQTKLNDTLGLLALKDIDIKEGLKTKTYEISVVNQKHDELVKKSLAFPNPTAKSMEVLIKILLMPLSDKTILDSHCFVHELKKEMHDDLEYVKSLEKEIDELESEKADFSNIYDLLLEECVSKDVTCSYLHSMSHLNANTELQCMYLHKVKECECLALKLSKRTESVNKEVHNNLLKSFSKLEKHSISLELSLQHCKEQMKNNPVCKENASNVFRKEREQYHEIQDLKAQMQDKNMVINELKKLILVTKGKSVETQFDKPSVVRQPNAQRIPKPSVLGKPTPFSNSPEMRSFQTKQSVNKTNVSDGLFKPVTQQNLPQNRNQAVRNTNVLKPGMYRIASTTTQTKTPQLPHASRNTNPHMSKSSGVIHSTSVSRPQLKSYQVKEKVVPNISQVKFTKKEVEDHHRISSISKKTKSVTACNDSSNSRTSNVNAVCAECGKCVFNSNHDACVSRYLKDVNARTKKPHVVPISASKPKRKANKSVATPHKKTVASDTTIQKSKSYYKKLYEDTNQEWKWWIAKRCPSGYTWTQKPLRTKKIWMPKIRKDDVSSNISPTIDIIVQLILFIVDSGCTKHMTGNLKLLCNFVEKFLGTVRFGNDQFAPILGYGDLIQGNVTIKRVYYVEGLNHNLFSVGQFCDADLEVAFRKSTCFVRDLQGNDLLTGSRGSDLYTISLQETTSSTPICFMAKASPTQAWLWHRRLSHLNFDYITLLSKKEVVNGLPKLKYVKDQLCSSCEMSKAKRSSFKTKAVPSSKGRLNLLHMDLCGPMRVASINGKKYILVIVDDYSRYTWTLFLRSKDETPEVLKDFLTMIQRNLQAQVLTVRTDRGTEFLNKTLHAYFKEEGIKHQTSIARTPEQNGVVERRNRTLVEAARTMLSASKLPLSFWAEAVATACYTQNRSIIISTHGKTAYHIINDRKPSIKHLHIFGCTCYITRDGENLDKMKEKGDPCVMVGYSTQSKGYRVYNKRTRLIAESIHIKFDEIKEMMSDHNSSDLAPQRQEMSVENVSSGLVPQGQKASDYDNSDPVPPRQNVVPTAEKTDSSQQGLEFLFSPLLEEYYNPTHGQQLKAETGSIHMLSESQDDCWDHSLVFTMTNGNPSSVIIKQHCGSVNGKKYILVIVDDYSRFTWVNCCDPQREAPAFIINFLKMIQVRLKETVRRIRTDNGTEFVNQTLREYYEKVGISHETSVARSPQQNGVVERRNRTLIEAARTMLIYAKAPLFLLGRSGCHSLLYPKSFHDTPASRTKLIYMHEVISPIPEVVAPEHAVSTGSPFLNYSCSRCSITQIRGYFEFFLSLLSHEHGHLSYGCEDCVLNGNIGENLCSQQDGLWLTANLNVTSKKALYGLKTSSSAWILIWFLLFLISNDFSKGQVDPTLFIRREGQEHILFTIGRSISRRHSISVLIMSMKDMRAVSSAGVVSKLVTLRSGRAIDMAASTLQTLLSSATYLPSYKYKKSPPPEFPLLAVRECASDSSPISS
ncbi:retrovirus-related pol polyprotein from transposon TNT 1-94 [Tanacetum coccineum]